MTLTAPHCKAQKLLPAGGALHPGPADKGGIMPHVLLVAAGQLGHPIAQLILVKPDDFSLYHIDELYRKKAKNAKDARKQRPLCAFIKALQSLAGKDMSVSQRRRLGHRRNG